MPTPASRLLVVLTLLPLTVLAQATANPAPATPYIDGAWAGALDLGPMQLHIVFVEAVEFPDLNHLFQPAKTRAPAEYAHIEETIAPAALEKIATWILRRPQLITMKP